MQPIEKILFLEKRGVLSLVGGGGKTSLLFHFAQQLARSGKKVLTTTTTKIFVPTHNQSQTVIISADPEEVLLKASQALRSVNHITAAAAHMIDTGKLQGFAPEMICKFQESGLFDWILVEADGASQRPLKAPAEFEPVVPPNTSVLVAVIGLEVLGEPLREELVFRSAIAGALMGLSAGEIITESALARLCAHPAGSFKGAPPQARRIIFLNKSDSPERRDCGSRVADCLRKMARPIAETLIVGQALDAVCVHAVHSLMVRA